MTLLRRGLQDAEDICRIGIDFFLLLIDPESDTIRTTDRTRFHPLGVAFVSGAAVALSAVIVFITYNWISIFQKWGILSAVFAFAPLFVCVTRFANRWGAALVASGALAFILSSVVGFVIARNGVGDFPSCVAGILLFIFSFSVSFSILVFLWNNAADGDQQG